MLVEARMIKKLLFFYEKNKVGYGQQEVPMTISKHYEHEYILLSTMTKIKLTTNKDKGHLFTIECYMPSFEPQNKTVHIWHTGMFKHDKYTFHPQEDLVFSMPYDFVANLKPGHWTLLDNLWLKSVKKILKKAKTIHQTNKACKATKKAFHWKSNHVIRKFQWRCDIWNCHRLKKFIISCLSSSNLWHSWRRRLDTLWK